MSQPDIEAEFHRALTKDASGAPPDIPAPPRRTPPEDRDAPFGRDDDGKAIAPFGYHKKTGKPNLKAPTAGAGRPPKGEQPRVQDGPQGAADTAPGKSYAEDLAGLATGLWIAGSGLPVTAPYAAVLKEHTPGLVGAWDKAAQQNAQVRRQVEKLAGDGSWAWVIGVAVATGPALMSMWDLMKPVKDPKVKAERDQVKKELAAKAKEEAHAYLEAEFMRMIAEQEQGQLEAVAA